MLTCKKSLANPKLSLTHWCRGWNTASVVCVRLVWHAFHVLSKKVEAQAFVFASLSNANTPHARAQAQAHARDDADRAKG